MVDWDFVGEIALVSLMFVVQLIIVVSATLSGDVEADWLWWGAFLSAGLYFVYSVFG